MSDLDLLTVWVRDARPRTLALVADLSDEQWLGPRLPIVNPLRWQVGHLAWFQEKWVLRRSGMPWLWPDADALYDPAQVPHAARWDLPLPARTETLDYLERVQQRVLERTQQSVSDEDRYFLRLAVFHEDVQGEAILHARQALGYPAPPLPEAAPAGAAAGPWPGDVQVPGGTFLLGAPADEPFALDNERAAHPVAVRPFAIARAPVTQGEFQAFVERGGYHRPQVWSDEAWRWRQAVGATQPVYWRRSADGSWQRRHFDRWLPLEPHQPMVYVSGYEAEAYCRWVGRRLPIEAEWEAAAVAEPDAAGRLAPGKRRFPWGDAPPGPTQAHTDAPTRGCIDVAALPDGDSAFGCRQLLGNVWEWTASDFLPYPGFAAGPGPDYSLPHFGTHKVLRGGCFATPARLLRCTWRHFHTPDRRDVGAGFRTCAL